MRIGYFLSSEEWGPRDLVSQAIKAREAGFDRLWISDHFHPWSDAQGHSPFVWTTIGALAQAVPGMHITTAVTCPTTRIHPAVIAQAAATAAVISGGEFTLGVGTGEALNEHIFGDVWPEAEVRREMLEEAVELIRKLWRGDVVSHHGRHYTVQHARIYDLPKESPKIVVSGFGHASVDLAGWIGDGFATVGQPDREVVNRFRQAGPGGDQKLVQSGLKVCWDSDEERARKIAHRLWPNDALPGELAQILPTPAHFEQACQLVSEEMVAEQIICGSDVDRHVAAINRFEDAGFDELYIQQVGPGQDEFFRAYGEHVLPRLQTPA